MCAGVAGCLCLEGARVLCIDADLGLRNLDISLGMASEASVSFLEVMRGDYTLEQAPRAAGLSGLQLLTAPVSVCAEDLDEAQFASLIDEARRRNPAAAMTGCCWTRRLASGQALILPCGTQTS